LITAKVVQIGQRNLYGNILASKKVAPWNRRTAWICL